MHSYYIKGITFFRGYGGMADALDLESNGQPCKFESYYPHQLKKTGEARLFFVLKGPLSALRATLPEGESKDRLQHHSCLPILEKV